MDPAILKQKNVQPRNPRKVELPGYELCFGPKVSLLRVDGKYAYGMVYDLNHDELHRLYEGSGVDGYVSEAVLVKNNTCESISALCRLLLEPPVNCHANPDYAASLEKTMRKLGLPMCIVQS